MELTKVGWGPTAAPGNPGLATAQFRWKPPLPHLKPSTKIKILAHGVKKNHGLMDCHAELTWPKLSKLLSKRSTKFLALAPKTSACIARPQAVAFQMKTLSKFALTALIAAASLTANAAPAAWQDSLEPLPASEWSRDRAAHLLERAGFGGTPAEVARLAAMPPSQAVRALVYSRAIQSPLPPFEDSGAFDPGLDPFAPSRPAATDLAKASGEALGVKAKPAGNRKLQQVADRYLYWKRVTKLETERIAYWWANRMVLSQRPLEEKMALFWHGHFATGDEKVQDYARCCNRTSCCERTRQVTSVICSSLCRRIPRCWRLLMPV